AVSTLPRSCPASASIAAASIMVCPPSRVVRLMSFMIFPPFSFCGLLALYVVRQPAAPPREHGPWALTLVLQAVGPKFALAGSRILTAKRAGRPRRHSGRRGLRPVPVVLPDEARRSVAGRDNTLLGGHFRLHFQSHHRLARDGIRDSEPAAQVLQDVPHLVEFAYHLRPRLDDAVEAVPFADEAVGTLARLDERHATQSGLPHPRELLRVDAAVHVDILLLVTRSEERRVGERGIPRTP